MQELEDSTIGPPPSEEKEREMVVEGGALPPQQEPKQTPQVGNQANMVLEAAHKIQLELQALITAANHQSLSLQEAKAKI